MSARIEKHEADGPTALAFRMASYIADAKYISAYTAREYGRDRAVPVERILEFQAHHRRPSRRGCSYERIAAAAEARERMRREARAAEQAKIDALRAEMAEADAQTVREALQGFLPLSQRIVAAVAYAFGMPIPYMTGPSRNRRAVLARFVAIRLLRDQLDEDGKHRYSTPQIGRMVGRSDHSTVLHALHNFDKQMADNPKSLAIYERLSGILAERKEAA